MQARLNHLAQGRHGARHGAGQGCGQGLLDAARKCRRAGVQQSSTPPQHATSQNNWDPRRTDMQARRVGSRVAQPHVKAGVVSGKCGGAHHAIGHLGWCGMVGRMRGWVGEWVGMGGGLNNLHFSPMAPFHQPAPPLVPCCQSASQHSLTQPRLVSSTPCWKKTTSRAPWRGMRCTCST